MGPHSSGKEPPMRPFALASASLFALAALGTPSRAAELPPELAGLEQEGEKWFREAGRTDT